LLLLGVTKNDGYKDPYPIVIPGRKEAVLSYKVEEYVNDEFYFYWNFYNCCKHCGLPYTFGWAEHPPWVAQLIVVFDNIIENEKTNGDRKFSAQIHGYRVT